MAKLAAFDWPGADGAVWGREWATAGTGTVDTQAGAGRMLVGSSTAFAVGPNAYYSNLGTGLASYDLTVDVQIPTLGTAYIVIGMGAVAGQLASGGQPANGYAVELSPATNNFTVNRHVTASRTTLATVAHTFAAGAWVRVNVTRDNTTGIFTATVWDGQGNPKPATPDYSAADTGTYQGLTRPHLSVSNGSAAVARSASFDNLVLNGTAVPLRWTGATIPTGTSVTSSAIANTAGSGDTVVVAVSGTYTALKAAAGGIDITAAASGIWRLDLTRPNSYAGYQAVDFTVQQHPTAAANQLITFRNTAGANVGYLTHYNTSGLVALQTTVGGTPTIVAGSYTPAALVVGHRMRAEAICVVGLTATTGRLFYQLTDFTDPTWSGSGTAFYDTGFTIDVGTTPLTVHRVGKAGSAAVYSAGGFNISAVSWRDLAYVDPSTDPAVAKAQFLAPAVTQVTSTLPVSWSVSQSVVSTVDATWSTRAPVTSAVPMTWATRQAVVSERAAQWATRRSVTAAVVAAWVTRAAVTTERAASWATRQAVTAVKPTSWATRAGVTSTRPASWQTRQAVTAAAAMSWAVRQAVSREISTTWDVGTVTGVTSTLAVAWATRQAVVGVLPTSWSTRQGVVALSPAQWAVRQAVTAQRPAEWAVRAAVGAVLPASWDTRQGITALTSTEWAVFAELVAELEATWDVAFEDVDADLAVHFAAGPLIVRRAFTGPLIARLPVAGPLIHRLTLTGPEVL